MDELEKQDFKENLKIVMGNKKLQEVQSIDTMSFARSQSPSYQEHTVIKGFKGAGCAVDRSEEFR